MQCFYIFLNKIEDFDIWFFDITYEVSSINRFINVLMDLYTIIKGNLKGLQFIVAIGNG